MFPKSKKQVKKHFKGRMKVFFKHFTRLNNRKRPKLKDFLKAGYYYAQAPIDRDDRIMSDRCRDWCLDNLQPCTFTGGPQNIIFAREEDYIWFKLTWVNNQ